VASGKLHRGFGLWKIKIPPSKIIQLISTNSFDVPYNRMLFPFILLFTNKSMPIKVSPLDTTFGQAYTTVNAVTASKLLQ
jgi:hypothetical protein